MPDYLKHWGTQSWKKHLNHYLHVTDSFFVFPRIGLSTNFDDPGTHADRSGLFQTTLLQGSKKIVFAALQESRAIYDSWFEIKPICIKTLRPEWRTYDFTVDLYGTKNLETVTTPYLLSSKKCAVPIKSFGNQIPGATENILQTVDGNFFYLGQTAHFRPLSRADMSPFHISIRALSDLVFRQYLDYPPLIVFIQSTGINSDLLQTLQSVYSQGYNPNHLEVKIVCQSDECIDLPEQFSRAELILLPKGESYLAVVTGLVKQSASVYGVLAIAGDVFFDDAFNTVSKVFKTYPYIYWITGAYAERSKAGFSKSGSSLPQNRWTKDIFYKTYINAKEKNIVPSATFGDALIGCRHQQAPTPCI
ncbi:MAG: hypothetical protein IPN29_02050 [Saprospiraceae bacterium]|nr:hypothetical protein [Saprospiraceae bacterium]